MGCCPWDRTESDTVEATEQDIQMLMIIFLVAVHLFKQLQTPKCSLKDRKASRKYRQASP